jgi:hypothetical protein
MAAVPESAEWILRAMNDQGRRADQAATRPADLVAPPEARPSPARKAVKALLLGLYRLVRPVLRPILWRTRAFFTQPVLAEITDVKQLLLAETASLRRQIEIADAELAVLRDEMSERDRMHEDGQAAAIDRKDFDALIADLRREVEAQDRGAST